MAIKREDEVKKFLDKRFKKYYAIRYFTEKRLKEVLLYCQGFLLDIGCGDNELVRRYGNGVGIDIVDWGEGAIIIKDTTKLPFSASTFDAVTLVASLNHIPYRLEVLKEARRVIKSEGRLIITMINPLVGFIAHKLFFWLGEEKVRGRDPLEKDGMWSKEIFWLTEKAGFKLKMKKKFLFFLNNLYIFVPY